MLFEGGYGVRAAAAELVPRFFGRHQRVAQAAQRYFLWRRRHDIARRGRNQALQTEKRLHLRHQHALRGRGTRHGIKDVAHEAFGDIARTLHKATDLGIDARQQLACFGIGFAGMPEERFGERRGRPPEGTCARRILCGFDVVERGPHLLERIIRLPRVLHPGQQATLEPRTLGLEERAQLFCRHRRRRRIPSGWAQGKVREEKVRRTGGAEATRPGQGIVGRQQAQRLVRLTGNQIVQVLAQGRDGRSQGHRNFLTVLRMSFLNRGQERLKRLGELGDAVKAHDGQRTVHLMDMRATEAQLHDIVAGLVLPERLGGARQRKIDLTLDPGERAQIEFARRVHDLPLALNPP